jgi:hypothetical protein
MTITLWEKHLTRKNEKEEKDHAWGATVKKDDKAKLRKIDNPGDSWLNRRASPT